MLMVRVWQWFCSQRAPRRVALVALASLAAGAGVARAASTDPVGFSAVDPISTIGTPPPSIPVRSDAATRLLTRTRYHGQSAADAIATIQSATPESLNVRAWRPLDLPSDRHVAKYLNSDHLAQVVGTAGQGRVLMSSTLPMRVLDPQSGAMSPVDLRLEHRSGAYHPINSYVPVTFSDSLAGGIDVGNVGLHVRGGSSAAAVHTTDSVVWPNALTDTDAIARAVPAGAELRFTLRSEASPEVLPVDLDLPDGAAVALSAADPAGRHLEIDGADGAIIATISAPIAWDADHTPVDAAWTLSDGTPTLHVVHHGKDLTWPITVDPTVNDERYGWDLAIRPWTFSTCCGTRFAPFYGDAGWGPGAYQRDLDYNYYWTSETSKWEFDLGDGDPGPNTSVWRQARVLQLHAESMGHDAGGTCTYMNVWSRGWGGWEYPWTSRCDSYRGYSADVGNWANTNGGSDGNDAQVGMYSSNEGWRSYFQQYIAALVLALQDNNAPATPDMSAPSGWTTGSNQSMTAHSTDKGLGISGITLKSSLSATWPGPGDQSIDRDCGNSATKCAQERSTAAALATLPEGQQIITAVASDPAGNASTTSSETVKIDRSAPVIDVGDDSSLLASGTTPITNGQDLFALNFAARDGDSSDLGSRRSGVQALSLYIDDQQQDSASSDATCADSCGVTLPEYTFAFDDYAPGSEHTIKVVADDRMGHEAIKTWIIKVPSPDDYASLLISWRQQVESQVDASSPLPLVGSMPTVPDDWRDASNCGSSADAAGACFDRAKQWIRDTQAWLDNNHVPATDFSQLPQMPTYGWAPVVTATDLIAAMAAGFDAIKETGSAPSPTSLLHVAVYFHGPQTPATALGALGQPAPQGRVEFRGVFEPGSDAVSGGATQTAVTGLAAQVDQFYADQQALASNEATEIRSSIADPTGAEGPALDSDDTQAMSTQAEQFDRMSAALSSHAGYVTATALTLSAAQVKSLILSPSDTVKQLSLLPLPDPSQPEVLEQLLSPVPTDADVAADYAADSAAAAPFAARSSAASSSSSIDGESCYQSGLAATKRNEVPESFMPNRMQAKVALNGGAQSNGRHNKVSHLFMRWVRPGSLSWYCGAPMGKRAFEPETKPEDNKTVDGPNAEKPWSGNWSDADWISTLPDPNYQDDLACGSTDYCDKEDSRFRASTYPDFSIGTSHARALRYGKLYETRFETNTGEADSGNVLVRGQQNERYSKTSEQLYCYGRSAAAGRNVPIQTEPRYCLFGRGTYKSMTIPLRASGYAHRAYDWTPTSRPSDYRTGIGTSKGSGPTTEGTPAD